LRTVKESWQSIGFNYVAVQEIRWDKGGTEPQKIVHFSMLRGMVITPLADVLFIRYHELLLIEMMFVQTRLAQ
jgi:hypothetical protein